MTNMITPERLNVNHSFDYFYPLYGSTDEICFPDLSPISQQQRYGEPESLLDQMTNFLQVEVENWTGEDCTDWASNVCERNGIDRNIVNFWSFRDYTGRQLVNFSHRDVCDIVGTVYGLVFYEDLQKMKRREGTESSRGGGGSGSRISVPSGAAGSWVLPAGSPTSQDSPWSGLPLHEDYMDSFVGPLAKNLDDMNIDGCEVTTLYGNQAAGGYGAASGSYGAEAAGGYGAASGSYSAEAVRGYGEASGSYGAEAAGGYGEASGSYGAEAVRGYGEASGSYGAEAAGGYGEASGSYGAEAAGGYGEASGSYGAEAAGGYVEAAGDADLSRWDWALEHIATEPRGRKRNPKVWEFLVRLLVHPSSNPDLVMWEDESTGTFRLMRPKLVARLWGKRSEKPNLSYNNFARSIRHHYDSGHLVAYPERQLVYRLGPESLRYLNSLRSSHFGR